jgi:predicted metalloendopeptidase
LIHDILLSTMADCDAKPPPPHSPAGEVAAFYASAMNTNRLEQLGFDAAARRFRAHRRAQIHRRDSPLAADLHDRNIPALFDAGVSPDSKNSGFYAFEFSQGGLGLPDRDYYLTTNFAAKLAAYPVHIAKMFVLAGETESEAKTHAATVLDLETALAKACKARADLRDPVANYHKFTVADAAQKYPHLALRAFLDASGIPSLRRGDHPPARLFRRPGHAAARAPAGGLENLPALARPARLRALSQRRRRIRIVRLLWHNPQRPGRTGTPLETLPPM